MRPGLRLAVRYGLTILLFTELIKRLRILTLTLLPLEVNRESINDPTSRIITPDVISAYTKAAGNLVEAVCVPSLRRCVNIPSPVVSYPTASFVPVVTSWSGPTVTLQTMERIVDEVCWLYILLFVISHFVAIACEVLARRIVHNSPSDRIPAIMSSRYRHRQLDGDIEFTSAIELAIDSHW